VTRDHQPAAVAAEWFVYCQVIMDNMQIPELPLTTCINQCSAMCTYSTNMDRLTVITDACHNVYCSNGH